MERDVLNNTQLIFGLGKMSLYEKQKTELAYFHNCITRTSFSTFFLT